MGLTRVPRIGTKVQAVSMNEGPGRMSKKFNDIGTKPKSME
jgi:hypothetical protein